MVPAVFDQVRVDIQATADGAAAYLLRANGQTMKFDGFRRVYAEGRDDEPDEDEENRLPELTDAQILKLLEILPEQHFTTPPPRFTEASLVKTLEAMGIGRPSTYASILSNLVERDYVRLEERRFFAEDIGKVVIEKVLVPRFPEIVDYEFTARMEEELDEIAEGNIRWTQVLDEFYAPFEREMEKAEQELERSEITSEGTGKTCPKCGQGEVVEKLGRFGRFLSCNRYPDCDYTAQLDGSQRPEPKLLEETCPECGKQLVQKVGRFGPFIGCSGYPDCKYVKREEQKVGVTCPKCGEGDLIVKRARRRGGSVFYGCNRYPECDFTIGKKPLPEPCPKCGGMMAEEKDDSAKCTSCGHVIEGGGEAASGAAG
jgi:DNA topoisomerase-1